MEAFYSASICLRSSVLGGVLDYADISKAYRRLLLYALSELVFRTVD